jgi:excisionase family DNA binding protein
MTTAQAPAERPTIDVLTSRSAARLCGVSFRTVIRWIERGELQAYRLPGRGDYRIEKSDLHRFMGEHGIPNPDASRHAAKRVLVVDDEAPMAKAIKRVLTRAGYEAVIAGDGFLAGSLLHTFKPALMTLDLRMPGLDGFAVLRMLSETRPLPFLKVLVISGERQDRLREALTQGADAVLEKPFVNEDLLQAVQRLLGAPR